MNEPEHSERFKETVCEIHRIPSIIQSGLQLLGRRVIWRSLSPYRLAKQFKNVSVFQHNQRFLGGNCYPPPLISKPHTYHNLRLLFDHIKIQYEQYHIQQQASKCKTRISLYKCDTVREQQFLLWVVEQRMAEHKPACIWAPSGSRQRPTAHRLHPLPGEQLTTISCWSFRRTRHHSHQAHVVTVPKSHFVVFTRPR